MDSNLTKTFVYWPDGSWKEVPSDGFVYASPGGTFQWDGMLEVWVSGWSGNIVDFTPPNMPSKVLQKMGDSSGHASPEKSFLKCECGCEKVGSPNHSHWCPVGRS